MPASTQTTLDGSLIREEWRHIDGIDSLARDPTEAEERWGITAEELEMRHNESPRPSGDLERRCGECNRRVTKLLDGNEAGHATGWRVDVTECSQHPGSEVLQERLDKR